MNVFASIELTCDSPHRKYKLKANHNTGPPEEQKPSPVIHHIENTN